MSMPRPIGVMPVATAQASPPLEPPTVSFGSKGLRVRPCRGLTVHRRSASSELLVRPINTAPAALRRSTAGASAYGKASRWGYDLGLAADVQLSRYWLVRAEAGWQSFVSAFAEGGGAEDRYLEGTISVGARY